jgi:putative ABC transport system substrate-binding protein
LVVLNVSNEADFDGVFELARQDGVAALFTSDDPILINHRVKLTTLALQYSIPAVYSNRDMVEAGGLMAYGTNYADTFRQIGAYAGRILKGESPSNLPVMQPAKFDFVVNKKVAAAMGLTIPPQLIVRADEVIE